MSWSWLLSNVIASMLLPPFNALILLLPGLMLVRKHPRLGYTLAGAGILLLLAFSLGAVSRLLLAPLEAQYPPLDATKFRALDVDAVVILGAGRYRDAPEFGSDDVIGPALDRLRYGALLARSLKRPLLVTGGAPEGGGLSEAAVMKRSLERDFGVSVRWVEDRSDNTFENARNSAAILKSSGVGRVALVTHAWHMPRAVQAFAAAGVEVVAAPTGYSAAGSLSPLDFLPRAPAMQASARALHEWIGIGWYRLRH